ncbi:MAG TPA: SET domain-containing protein [Bacteroidia bacterium]|jgi:SET domain-containing protein|nr:SET domain-containing protein [Bacteroidia bacterium]
MLIKNTVVKRSRGRGMGLFANVNIKKGEKYWIRDEKFDKPIPLSEFKSYKKIARDYIIHYGFQEKSKNWYLCSDNARFTNHSPKPNTENIFDNKGRLQYAIATKDIKKDKEIFCEYGKLCLTYRNKPVKFKSKL